jgi:hypothetical protein
MVYYVVRDRILTITRISIGSWSNLAFFWLRSFLYIPSLISFLNTLYLEVLFDPRFSHWRKLNCLLIDFFKIIVYILMWPGRFKISGLLLHLMRLILGISLLRVLFFQSQTAWFQSDWSFIGCLKRFLIFSLIR